MILYTSLSKCIYDNYLHKYNFMKIVNLRQRHLDNEAQYLCVSQKRWHPTYHFVFSTTCTFYMYNFKSFHTW